MEILPSIPRRVNHQERRDLNGQMWLKGRRDIVLKKRYREILILVCLQYTDREIGERLGLMLRTVQNDRHRLRKKVGCQNSAGLVMYAIAYNHMRLSFRGQEEEYGRIWLESRGEIILNKRDRDLLILICFHQTDYQIGKRLGKAFKTIQNDREDLLKKIGAKNSAGLVMYAIQYKVVRIQI